VGGVPWGVVGGFVVCGFFWCLLGGVGGGFPSLGFFFFWGWVVWGFGQPAKRKKEKKSEEGEAEIKKRNKSIRRKRRSEKGGCR